jgi:hypothetical protein
MNMKRSIRKTRVYLAFIRALIVEQIPQTIVFLLERLVRFARNATTILIPLLATISFIVVLYTVGFEDFYQLHERTYRLQQWILLSLAILFIVRLAVFLSTIGRWRSRIFNILMVVLIFY